MERQDAYAMESTAADAVGTEQSSGRTVDDAPVTLTLPAQSRYVRVARLVAAGLANELGYGVDRLDDVRLAIGEACGLAAQAGAAHLTVTYALEEHRLDVSLEAELDSARELDREYLALVEQVLRVACSDHDLGFESRRLSARLVFNDER
jgi:serine/threonine-protein kinase RsbW